MCLGDGETELKERIERVSQIIPRTEAKGIIENTPVGHFDVVLTQAEYRVVNHLEFDECVGASFHWAHPIPQQIALASFLHGYLVEKWGLVSALVHTRNAGTFVGALVVEAYAGHPEKHVFYRSRVGNFNTGSVSEWPKSMSEEEGLILF